MLEVFTFWIIILILVINIVILGLLGAIFQKVKNCKYSPFSNRPAGNDEGPDSYAMW